MLEGNQQNKTQIIAHVADGKGANLNIQVMMQPWKM